MPTVATLCLETQQRPHRHTRFIIPVLRGFTPAVAPPPLNWPTKNPTDVLDYQFDITPAVIGNDGDGIATLDVTIEPANPDNRTLNSATVDGNVAGAVVGPAVNPENQLTPSLSLSRR